MIGWQTICKPKEGGGLGFRRARDMNKALLAKLCWRFLMEQDKLWVRLMGSKYPMDQLQFSGECIKQGG